MISQVTSKFQNIHLDWQYLDPRFPLPGYKRLFNLQGYHNFEIATYLVHINQDSIYKNSKHIQFCQKYFRCTWFFDFVQLPSSWFKMTVNLEKSRVPSPTHIPALSNFFVSPPLSSPLECASALNKVLPEEFLDLSPGVLLGCGVAHRVPPPKQGAEEAAAPGRIAQGQIGRLYEVARPGVEQHPSVASAVPPQLVQGLLSVLSAIEAFVILPYNEEDRTLGLFNRKHTVLIQCISGVPLIVTEAQSAHDVELHALRQRGDGCYNQIPVLERKFKDGIAPIDADSGCHLLQVAGHGQPNLCTFAHRDHSNSWLLDLKEKIKETHYRTFSEKELSYRPVS